MSALLNIPQAQRGLSIQIDLNGLSFVVQDIKTEACAFWRYYPYQVPQDDYNLWHSEVAAIMQKEQLLQESYAQCRVLFNTEKHTLIPSALFQDDQAARVLKQLFTLDDLDEVNHCDFPSSVGATCLYALPGPLCAEIIRYHRSARFYSNIIPLFSYLSLQQEYSKALFFYSPSFIHVIIMQGAQLLLCNAYAVDRFSTALYHLFFALKQWQLNPHSLSLFICGMFKPVHLKQLCSYFPSVTVATSSGFVFPSESLNLQFAPLIFPDSSSLCASSAAV